MQNYSFSILLVTVLIFTSCQENNEDNELNFRVRDNLDKLYEAPINRDNSVENKKFIAKNFQDSGVFNTDNNKTGIWVEYTTEEIMLGVPMKALKGKRDNTHIRITSIYKQKGEYENGKKVGKWRIFKLMNREKPFKWEEKANIPTSSTFIYKLD